MAFDIALRSPGSGTFNINLTSVNYVYASGGAGNGASAGDYPRKTARVAAVALAIAIAGAGPHAAKEASAAAANAAIAGASPVVHRVVYGSAGGANGAIGFGRPSREFPASAGTANGASAGGEPSRGREASAGSANGAFAWGDGDVISGVFAQAGAANGAIAGGRATASKEASAGSSNAGIAGALAKAAKLASDAAANGAIAGAFPRVQRNASAAGAAEAIAGANPFLHRTIQASAGAANEQIAAGNADVFKYIPASIDRDVDPRIREALVDESGLEAIVDYRNRGLVIGVPNYIAWGGVALGDLERWTTPTDAYGYNETKSGTSTIIQDQTIPHGGASCARMDIDSSNSGAYLYPQTTITLVAGRRMKFSIWYRTADDQAQAFIWIKSNANEVYLQPDGSWSATISGIVLPPTSGIWTKYEIEFSVHNLYTGYYVYFGAGNISTTGSAAANGTIYFDDVLLTPVDDGIIRQVEFKAEDGIDVAYYHYPVLNGGMESWISASNLSSWTEIRYGSSTINREATIVHSGTYAVRLTIDATNNLAQIEQTATIRVNKRYRVSFWYRTDTGKKIAPFVRGWINGAYRYLQPDGSWKNNTDPGYAGYSYLQGGVEAADWTKNTFEFISPPVVSSNQLAFGLYNEAAASGNLYGDDFEVVGAFQDVLTAEIDPRIRDKEIEIK